MRRTQWFISVTVSLLVIVLIRLVILEGQRTQPVRHQQVHHAARPAPRPAIPTTANFAAPVLMYHHIGYPAPDSPQGSVLRDLTVPPDQFKRQMEYLVDNGFQFVSAREVAAAVRERKPLPIKSVAVTIDDGYQDAFDNAFPVLRRHKIPATVFLVTAAVGTPGHLSWREISIMRRHGIEFGSHTVHHYDLPSLSSKQANAELHNSRVQMERELAESIRSIAYPAGSYSERVIGEVATAGYLAGWRKEGGPVMPSDNAYLLPRVRVHGDETLNGFARILRSAR